MNFYSLQVERVEKITSKSIRIDLSIPKELRRIFVWRPGQFIRFRFEIDNKILEREYSICSAPFEQILSVAIKEVATPYVSKYIQTQVKKGDILLISAPMGNFGIPSRPNEKRTLVAFCGGSGITPILSIIKNTLKSEPGVSFYLFYGNTHEEDVMFKNELDNLAQENSENFFLYYFYSEQSTEDKLFRGFLDEHKLKLIINQILDWDEVDEVLICGPKPMIIGLANATYKQGIPKKNIHFELYEPIDKIFYDDQIQRSMVKEVEVTFIYEGETYVVNWINNGSTLLDFLLDAGFDVPYSCKGGVCGTCQCTKLEGEVILGENLVLTDEDIKNGKMLTCVAHPKTEKLKINLDEH